MTLLLYVKPENVLWVNCACDKYTAIFLIISSCCYNCMMWFEINNGIRKYQLHVFNNHHRIAKLVCIKSAKKTVTKLDLFISKWPYWPRLKSQIISVTKITILSLTAAVNRWYHCSRSLLLCDVVYIIGIAPENLVYVHILRFIFVCSDGMHWRAQRVFRGFKRIFKLCAFYTVKRIRPCIFLPQNAFYGRAPARLAGELTASSWIKGNGTRMGGRGREWRWKMGENWSPKVQFSSVQ